MMVIGLTGGIASGKSTASKILKELGAVIIDADKIAVEIVKNHTPAFRDIREYFGEEVVLESGEIDRKKLGDIVFNDSEALKILNNFTHPRIIEEIQKKINWYKHYTLKDVIIVDAALLIETNLKDIVDEIWLITIDEKLQRERLIKRNNLTIEEANKRILAQMPLTEKLVYANKLINNSGDIRNLEKLMKELWEMISRK